MFQSHGPWSSPFEMILLPELQTLEWTMKELPEIKMNTETELDPQPHVGAQWTEWTLLSDLIR